MSDLLSCPFCGGGARWAANLVDPREYRAECSRIGTCPGSPPTETTGCIYKEDAVRLWNTRVDPAPLLAPGLTALDMGINDYKWGDLDPAPASSFPCDPAKVSETPEAYVSGQNTAPAAGEIGDVEARLHRNFADALANFPPQYSIDWVNGIQPMLDYRLNQIIALRAQLAATADRLKELLTLMGVLHQAVVGAQHWHERQQKALSKSGLVNATTLWAMSQHREQIVELAEVLAAYDRFKGGH